MESAQDFLDGLADGMKDMESSNGKIIVSGSKAVGINTNQKDQLVGKAKLSQSGEEAMTQYEIRNARLGMPSDDDSEDMDDAVAENIADEEIDKLLGLI